jgi:prepilin-type N-terminal cleavage/methylation domain-containing protein
MRCLYSNQFLDLTPTLFKSFPSDNKSLYLRRNIRQKNKNKSQAYFFCFTGFEVKMAHNRRLAFLRSVLRTQSVQGFTLIEALVTISVVGILGAIAAPNILAVGNNPLPDTTSRIAGQFRSARAKAISQTSMFRVRPAGGTIATCALAAGGCFTNQLIVEHSTSVNTSCNAATGWTQDNYFTPEDLTFGTGISFSRAQINPVVGNAGEPAVLTNWQLCFDNRGIADKNLVLTLRQSSNSLIKRIEIFPGGTVQIHEN